LLAALVLTLTPTSAAVPLAAHAATAGFFTDPAGDSGVAADITAVSVGNDTLAGDIVIWIHMANREVLPDISDLFAVFFDTDLNAATGAPGSAGSEYTAQVFREIPGSILPAVFRWTGSAWLEVPAPTLNYGFGVDEKSLRVSIHPNEIGGTRTFNFHLVSALQGQSATDVAPDFGGWPYSLISGPLQLSVERFAVRPKVPRAGKSFTASLLVGREDTYEIVGEGSVACSLRVGKKAVSARAKSFVNSAATCGWTIPRKTKRQQLRMKISLKFGGVSISRTFAAKIR
jgi:hypothetical protein